jgi:hypothetical protein
MVQRRCNSYTGHSATATYCTELKYFQKAYQITITKDTANLHYKMQHHDSFFVFSVLLDGSSPQPLLSCYEAPSAPAAAGADGEPAC